VKRDWYISEPKFIKNKVFKFSQTTSPNYCYISCWTSSVKIVLLNDIVRAIN